MTATFTCLVCGWKGLENKPEFPFNSNEICACCGSEYGIDIQEHSDIQQVRKEWLNEGADWFDDEEDVKPRKPNNWNIQAAEQQILEAFGES